MTARLTEAEGAALLALARAAVEDALFDNQALAKARSRITMTPALTARRACFVTLKIKARDGALQLRGCIGTFEADEPAHEAVAAAARDAAFADPRFPPLTREEHRSVVISVSALTPMAPVGSADDIVLGRDGVVLEASGHRALFLPQVAKEHGWTVPELLAQLAEKAGLPRDAWRRGRLLTFEADSFGDE